jgi:tRNA A-37 threonylcarbamoyl transferase component Bud32
VDETKFTAVEREGFVGMGRSDWLTGLDDGRLSGLRKEIGLAREGVLARGRHQVVVRDFEFSGTNRPVAVKLFGKQQGWKDRYDLKRGSKAARSFRAASHLDAHGVATPAPLAYLERWEGGRLLECYYLSEYLDGLKSLKDELLGIYRANGPCSVLVDLLKKVGAAMRRMHDAGFYHRDLGNQNMELSVDTDGATDRVYFLDLNRSRIRDELSTQERALDFSRLKLPSAFLDILIRIYWDSHIPPGFRREVAKHQRRFIWWQKSRNWRHPVKSFQRARKNRGKPQSRLEDIWIWDDRSAQAAITLKKADRRKCQSWVNHSKIAWANLKSIAGVSRGYRRELAQAFQRPVAMTGRIGMALEPTDLGFEPQLAFLEELGPVPILMRFGHHEGKAQWDKSLAHLNDLHRGGYDIMVAVLQDRRAVLEPESWQRFLEYLFAEFDGKVSTVEIAHVINRMKWGIHNLREYNDLVRPVVSLQARYPDIQIVGPACIDFEFHYTVAALDHLPGKLNLAALSHHLYVDRRGAPENRQGRFGIVEKAALLKAIAIHSRRCDDRVIVSEVNWPLVNTAEWSPVAASYLPPGAEGSRTHVTEEQYGHYMIRYLALALCSGFVERVYWWRLVAHGFGLVDERADGGWRKRVGFQMLRTFLHELGQATFLEKLSTPENVYALRFARENDAVVLIWCNGRKFQGPWPLDYQKVLDSQGREIELTELCEEPVYLIAPLAPPRHPTLGSHLRVSARTALRRSDGQLADIAQQNTTSWKLVTTPPTLRLLHPS